MERFLYQVNPKRPIKNLSEDIPVIRSPKSLRLSKDEVLECLKHGIVRRRFANEQRVEQVTVSNVDRLHHANYMDEETYAKYLEAQVDSQAGTVYGQAPETVVNKEDDDIPPVVNDVIVDETVTEPTVEESHVEDTVVDEATKADETATEAATVESVKDDEDPEQSVDHVDDAADEATVEDGTKVDETVVEATTEETVVVDEKVSDDKKFASGNNKNNYGGKNKHKK